MTSIVLDKDTLATTQEYKTDDPRSTQHTFNLLKYKLFYPKHFKIFP